MAAKAKTKKAASRKVRKGSIADRIRLGEQAYAVKQASKPGDWKQIVTAAHAKGYTVASALSNVPDDLKARTHSSLKTQATKQVAEAYAPQTKALDYETGVANSIRDKRLADETSYNQWATQQMSLISAASQKAQQDYQDFIDKRSGAAKTAADAIAQGAQATAQQGSMRDTSQSMYLKGANERLQAQAQTVANQADEVRARTPSVVDRGNSFVIAQQGQHKAAVAQIEGAWGTASSEIRKSRFAIEASRAKDIITSYTDLLNKEMDKANANREFTTLQAQLDQKSAAQAQAHQEFLIGQKTTRLGQNKSAATTRRGQDISKQVATRGQTLTHQDKVADRQARTTQNKLDRASRESVAATQAASKDSTNVAKRQASNTKITAVVDTIADILRTQQRGKGGKRGSGYLWDADEQKWRPARQVLINRGATTPQINAGLAHARGQLLTPAQKAALGIIG